MIDLRNIWNIYLVPGYTDMRKQADGLLSILSVNYPNTLIKPNQLYIFCGRSRTIIKVVEVDGTGVWVYYKRLHGDKFLWPKENDVSLIDKRQLTWFLEGLNIKQKNAHKTKYFDY